MTLLNRLAVFAATGLVVACAGGTYVPVGEVIEVKTGDRVMVPMTFIDPHSPPRAFDILGIRCPDPSADDNVVEAYYGVLARDLVDKWTHNRSVTLERPLQRQDGLMDRSTGWIKDPDTGEYLHEILLAKGLARASLQGRQLGERGARIQALEGQASATGVGMFAQTHPPEHEMRRVIKQGSLLGQVTGMLGGRDTVPDKPVVPDEGGTVVPVQPTQPTQPVQPVNPTIIPDRPVPGPEIKAGTVQQLLVGLNAETEKARREFLSWQALPADRRKARAEGLRTRLRTLKIRLMDAADEIDGLDEVQRAFLEGLRSEMNRLMRLVPRD